MGSSKTSSSSTVQPWAPSIPLLHQELNGIGSQFNNYQPTGIETRALNQMEGNASRLPNLGPQATDLTKGFLSGDPYGLLKSGLSAYQNQMNPIANASLDPMQTPGIQNLLKTINSDVSGSVNGMFAGAGRDLSGMNTQTLARGISQGEAQPLLNQYNQNVTNRMNAANGLLGASGSVSGAMGQNSQAGFGMAQMIPGMTNMRQMAELQAAGLKRSLPLQNLAQLEGLTIPIAGLGQQSQSQSTQTPSLMQNLGMGSQMFSNMFGGQFSPFSNFSGMFKF